MGKWNLDVGDLGSLLLKRLGGLSGCDIPGAEVTVPAGVSLALAPSVVVSALVRVRVVRLPVGSSPSGTIGSGMRVGSAAVDIFGPLGLGCR